MHFIWTVKLFRFSTWYHFVLHPSRIFGVQGLLVSSSDAQMAGRLFADIPEISPDTLAELSQHGFLYATPVQEATIPLFAGNKDVSVDACTGSGKTLAFVIPIIERLRKLEEPLKKHQVGAIIVSPTRELARQIHLVAAPFIKTIPWMSYSLLVGGTDPGEDIRILQESGGNLLIGTPGRLYDIMQRCSSSTLDFKTLDVLVLDEADRLLDMGFQSQLDTIMKGLPRQRRTGLFSATQTEAVESLARAGLRNPVRIAVEVTRETETSKSEKKVEKQVTPSGLNILYTLCNEDEKLVFLSEFLKNHKDDKIIVYFLTCACVDFARLALPFILPGRWAEQTDRSIKAAGMQIWALHGRMKQAARESALAAFASSVSGVMFATDVAARGLDIPDVHWIVQTDPPQDPSAFVHRVGRTARMGRSGNALAYMLPHEASYVDFLKLRHVPMIQGDSNAPKEHNTQSILMKLQQEATKHRELMDAGVKAFISYIRAYKEHHCSYIFRLQQLDVGGLARGFGLLRLPRLIEIKKTHKGLSSFKPSDIDPDSVKYQDKVREKQRVANLKRKQEGRLASIAAHAVKKAAVEKAAKAPKLTATKRRQLESRQEFGDLLDDYALLKKLKRGKISEKEYEKVALRDGCSEQDDDGGGGPTTLIEKALERKVRFKKRKKKQQSCHNDNNS